MTKIFIKPAVKGEIVRHPQKRQYIIKDEGEWVEDSAHWQREIQQGSIVTIDKKEPESFGAAEPKFKSTKGESK